MIDNTMKIWLILALICLFAPIDGISQVKLKQPKLVIGFELGQWVPSSLNSEPDLALLKEVKNKPYLGIMLLKPLKYDFSFRCNAGIWKYYEEEPTANNKCVRIVSFLFDLKYTLLTDVFIQPYVSYGAGLFLGFDGKKTNPLLNFKGESEMGIGFNFGTGFDFQVTKKITLELEFRYHYVKFNNLVVFTDNYSGPKVSIAVLYFF